MSSLSALRILHLRPIVRQPLRSTLAAVAVAAGVTLTVASALLLSSINHSFLAELRSLGGSSSVRVVGASGEAWLSEATVAKVTSVPGVRSAAPTVQAVALAERPDGRKIYLVAVGVDCRAASILHLEGCNSGVLSQIHGNGPLLVSTSLKHEVGSGAAVLTDAGREPLDAAAALPALDRVNRGRIAVFSLQAAQHVFSRGHRYDAIYVQTARGVDPSVVRARIQRTVGSVDDVLPAGAVAPSEAPAGPLAPLLGFVGVIALGLSVLLVYNISSLSLAERRKDLAIAGAVGFESRRLRLGALTEASSLGAVGGVIGVIAGSILAHPLVDAASSVALEQGAGVRAVVYLSPGVLLAGVLIGMMTSILAAWIDPACDKGRYRCGAARSRSAGRGHDISLRPADDCSRDRRDERDRSELRRGAGWST